MLKSFLFVFILVSICAIYFVVRMGDDPNPPEGKHVVWNEFLKRIGESLGK